MAKAPYEMTKEEKAICPYCRAYTKSRLWFPSCQVVRWFMRLARIFGGGEDKCALLQHNLRELERGMKQWEN